MVWLGPVSSFCCLSNYRGRVLSYDLQIFGVQVILEVRGNVETLVFVTIDAIGGFGGKSHDHGWPALMVPSRPTSLAGQHICLLLPVLNERILQVLLVVNMNYRLRGFQRSSCIWSALVFNFCYRLCKTLQIRINPEANIANFYSICLWLAYRNWRMLSLQIVSNEWIHCNGTAHVRFSNPFPLSIGQ